MLVRYIRAYVEGRRWVLDPANKAEATKLWSIGSSSRRGMAGAHATAIATASDRRTDAKDAKFDLDGFQERAQAARRRSKDNGAARAPAPDKYLDLSYYDKAIAGL